MISYDRLNAIYNNELNAAAERYNYSSDEYCNEDCLNCSDINCEYIPKIPEDIIIKVTEEFDNGLYYEVKHGFYFGFIGNELFFSAFGDYLYLDTPLYKENPELLIEELDRIILKDYDETAPNVSSRKDVELIMEKLRNIELERVA